MKIFSLIKLRQIRVLILFQIWLNLDQNDSNWDYLLRLSFLKPHHHWTLTYFLIVNILLWNNKSLKSKSYGCLQVHADAFPSLSLRIFLGFQGPSRALRTISEFCSDCKPPKCCPPPGKLLRILGRLSILSIKIPKNLNKFNNSCNPYIFKFFKL